MQRIVLPQYAAEVLEKFNNAGYEAYVVGGCCRDAILGRNPNDWDVCTSAMPHETTELFPDNIPTGIKHGTVTVKIRGELIEVTTFRIDGDYNDHRRPDEVLFTSSLREDLARRDFTMNAMAANLDGNIVDYFGGMDDISKRVIRCVGEARVRFTEDALRMFRAVRFSAQLGFDLDDDLVCAAKDMAHSAEYVAPERIYAETMKALCADHPEKLAYALSWGLFPGVKKCSPEIALLSSLPQDGTVRLMALCSVLIKCCAISSVSGFLRSLRASAQQIKTAELIFDPQPVWTLHNLPKTVSLLGRDRALCAAAAMEAYGLRGSFSEMQKLLSKPRCLCVNELQISGSELKAMGFSGPDIGKYLNLLLEHVLQHPEDNDNEVLMKIINKNPTLL